MKLDSNNHSVFLMYDHLVLVVKDRHSSVKKGSSNWEKQRIRVVKIQEKVANQRKNFLHHKSKALVKIMMRL